MIVEGPALGQRSCSLGDDFAIRPLEVDDCLLRIYRDVLTPAFTSDELEPLEDLRG